MLRISMFFFLCCVGMVCSDVQNGILRKLISHNKAVVEEILTGQYEKVDKTFTISRLKAKGESPPHSNKGKETFTPSNDRIKDPASLLPFVEPFIRPILEAFAPTSDKVETPECRNHSKMYIEGLFNFAEWALRMLDATGKLPNGVMVGNVHSLGHFNECLSIQATEVEPPFKGKYCLVTFMRMPNKTQADDQVPEQTTMAGTETTVQQNAAITVTEQNAATTVTEQNTASTATEENTAARRLVSTSGNEAMRIAALPNVASVGIDPKTFQQIFQLFPRVGFCIPSSCTERDVDISLNDILTPLNNENDTYQVMDVYCYTKQETTSFRSIDIIVLVLYGVIFSLVVFGTIFDIYILYYPHVYFDEGLALRIMSKTLKSFSVMTNGKKLLGTEHTSETLGCLHGLRFISMTWVILGHSWLMALFIPWMNPEEAYNVFSNWAMHGILNPTVSVDTFFVISGLLVSYGLLKVLDKRGMVNPIIFVAHRYIRLTPTYALILAFMATLMDYMGSGPFWRLMEVQSEFCRKNWWTNLLYVNNYVNEDEACMGETWYLACDMHMYLLSPLLIYPLWRWRRVTLATLAVIILGSVGLRGALIYVNDYPPTVLPYHSSMDYFYEFYMSTYTRFAPYIVGIIMGFVIHCTRSRVIQLKPISVALAWAAATATGLSIVYGMYDYIQFAYKPAGTAVSVTYGSLHRLAWSLAVSWVIFACVKGYGGFVNTILSWKVFMPLSRLTYCSYLIHMHVQWLFHYSRKFIMVYDWYLMVYFFVGHLAVTTAGAFVLSLAFEAPFICLEKIIFRGGGQPTTKHRNTPPEAKSREEEMNEVTAPTQPLNGIKVFPESTPQYQNSAYTHTEEANNAETKKPRAATQFEEVHGKIIPKTEL